MPTVSAWVSDEEKARCVNVAKKLGQSESSIIKQAFKNAEILDVKKMKSIEIERLTYLNWIANSLSQISEYCNNTKMIDKVVLSCLLEMYNDVKNL